MAVQIPKFHALSVIQDQLRGSGMNLIPVCVCVRARVCVCVCVCGWVGGYACVRVRGSFGRTIIRCIWTVTVNFCLLKAEVKR